MSTFTGDAQSADKHAVARKSTLVSIVLNVVLATFQIAVGVIAHSQALIADGVHSISDLVSDFVVLVANRHSGALPDADHNYGHSRYETVASMFLGAILIAVGIGMLWRAGERLVHLEDIPPVHFSALLVAVTVLVSKEALFRYMLREARRVRSAMLVANAWHARSDAASSLVVAIGIVGSLAGFTLLDPIAAAIVGFMVARMGWTFGYDALQDLSDRALDTADTTEIRALLAATPGVRDVHDLRTRKMGDAALVDAHILVDPMISVSEGHYIAETARARVLSDPRVLDALIHVDPENDAARRPALALPPRGEIATRIEAALAQRGLRASAINLHYLSTGLEIDVTLAADSGDAAALAGRLDVDALKRQFGARRIGFTRALPA
ncbi:cation diffusion facilitator family transporter [Burkholderia pseudomultivorans]|uniref:Cation diffusion facilitator family transporter n=1 Tax=Burkholderia pseudomultivorans TaxID=1207504 RepID=A0A6P2P342_9BURK|nr:cation diffusion facilitator family transporter [Burkholderia pseudomultivorans]MDR8731998.1 putative cation efflux system protein [Burkholderia pseudomultivorans]MDR8736520.1 putative cation efflux system protein [Burkholderia pseudomultivorans]MDR8745318.1 putative cation efflux system protein [Burkholderia pseudomultivorans]MDR8757313.1 putative cation efflux system protein [Burkholderia pseudomultivorans]MDR8779326.1 putative cation efflux system protein [Burkholderia pseudomultivorans]